MDEAVWELWRGRSPASLKSRFRLISISQRRFRHIPRFFRVRPGASVWGYGAMVVRRGGYLIGEHVASPMALTASARVYFRGESRNPRVPIDYQDRSKQRMVTRGRVVLCGGWWETAIARPKESVSQTELLWVT